MALVEISTTPIPDDREELFSIDGTSYYIPREIPGSLTLQAIERARKDGEVEATMWVLDQVIGPEGMAALRECPTLRREDLLAIVKIVRDRVFGPVEAEGKA